MSLIDVFNAGYEYYEAKKDEAKANKAEARVQTAADEAAAHRARSAETQELMAAEFREGALPLYQQERDRYFSPEYAAEQQSLAEADYRRGVAVANQSRRRSALAMGLRPEDIVAQGEGTSARMATGLADARNRTAMGIRSQRMGVLAPGLGMGPGAASLATQTAGAATQQAGVEAGVMGYWGNQAAEHRAAGADALTRGAEQAAQAVGVIYGAPAVAAGAPSVLGGPYIPPGTGGAPPGIGFADGGLVEGPGTGTSDSVPAVIDGQQPAALSDGEYVIPADVTQYYGIKHLYGLETKAREDMASGMQGGARRTGGEPQQEGGARRMTAQPQVAA